MEKILEKLVRCFIAAFLMYMIMWLCNNHNNWRRLEVEAERQNKEQKV